MQSSHAAAVVDVVFGAFDFVIEPNGAWRFLECNANGQWLWLEHEVGLSIASALADLLCTGDLQW